MQETHKDAGNCGVRVQCVCKYCSKHFKPKHSTRVTFCSRECSFAYKAASPYSPVYASYCVGCGVPYVSMRKRLYCGDKCEARRVSIAPDTRQCKCCGNEYTPSFTGGRPNEYCAESCRSLVGAAHKRIAKARRKAVLRGATVEKVDPFKVFERDGWKCQLCGVKTPKSKRGTYLDNAPELDHIMPLAKGGEHSYINTQCSCRKCNGLKSDKPMGQMRLMG